MHIRPELLLPMDLIFHGSHTSQLQSIVLIGLELDIGPLPGVFVGRADKRLKVVALGQIVDPAGRSTGLHDDDVDFMFSEDCLQVIPLGGSVKEGMFPSFRVKQQHMVLNLPRSRARIFMIGCSLGLGLEFCDALSFGSEIITGQSRQIVFE